MNTHPSNKQHKRASTALTTAPDGTVTVRVEGSLIDLVSFCELRESAEIGLALSGSTIPRYNEPAANSLPLILDLRLVDAIGPSAVGFISLLAIRAQEQMTPLHIHVTERIADSLLASLADALGEPPPIIPGPLGGLSAIL